MDWPAQSFFIAGLAGTTTIFFNLKTPSHWTDSTSLGDGDIFFLLNPILFAICTSTFSKLCINVGYTATCRRELSSAPLYIKWQIYGIAIYQTTQRHIPGDSNLYSHSSENLRSHKFEERDRRKWSGTWWTLERIIGAFSKPSAVSRQPVYSRHVLDTDRTDLVVTREWQSESNKTLTHICTVKEIGAKVAQPV
jgi:hypothetical protein